MHYIEENFINYETHLTEEEVNILKEFIEDINNNISNLKVEGILNNIKESYVLKKTNKKYFNTERLCCLIYNIRLNFRHGGGVILTLKTVLIKRLTTKIPTKKQSIRPICKKLHISNTDKITIFAKWGHKRPPKTDLWPCHWTSVQTLNRRPK